MWSPGAMLHRALRHFTSEDRFRGEEVVALSFTELACSPFPGSSPARQILNSGKQTVIFC